MAPLTDFAVKDNYKYLEGFGNYHQSEAIPGASPAVNNSPQKPPYGLRTERISGGSFTAPRHHNYQTWLYRVTSSLRHGPWVPHQGAGPARKPDVLSPNSALWPRYPGLDREADWVSSQRLLAQNGDPGAKTGVALWVFAAARDMPAGTAFSSLDGDALVVPQSGALDVQTELGRLLVRQNEICVIPRGVRYRVTLPGGRPARGYICELFQGHFRLPELGPIGSTGLANVRDFQVPTACFDGALDGGGVAVAHDTDFTIISRQAGRLWEARQDHTPFDVAAWHGTTYPYKYDLGRFCAMGNLVFDEHDPSLYTVLSAPSYGEPGVNVVDFAIIPPRWMVGEDTLWLPYFHRNTMNEFYAPIVALQDPEHPFNGGSQQFRPFVAGLHGSMVTHGANEDDLQEAMRAPTTPTKVNIDGLTIMLLETEKPLYLSDWAAQASLKADAKPKGAAKI